MSLSKGLLLLRTLPWSAKLTHMPTSYGSSISSASLSESPEASFGVEDDWIDKAKAYATIGGSC